jgi:DNA-binding IclR family transcriptional regulator
MQAILILTTLIHSEGEGAFAYSFSAASIAEEQSMTVYKARKLLKELREFGLIYRMGNRYMFTMGGWNIAHDVIASAKRVTKYKGGE